MKGAKTWLKEFQQFLVRGNAVDLAVGVVIGAAFGAVVKSIVDGVLTPFIGAIAHIPDFSGLSFTINGSEFLIGNFLNALISFVLIAATIFFFVVKPMNILMERAKKEEKAKESTTKKCSECVSEIPIKATRCSFCTQVVK